MRPLSAPCSLVLLECLPQAALPALLALPVLLAPLALPVLLALLWEAAAPRAEVVVGVATADAHRAAIKAILLGQTPLRRSSRKRTKI